MQLETDLGVGLFGLPRIFKPLRDTARLLKIALQRFRRLVSFNINVAGEAATSCHLPVFGED